MRTISVIFLFLGLHANAFKLEPMVMDFAPSGPTSAKVFRVENESKNDVAVKIEAFVRQIDSKGVEKRIPTSDFSIFPTQLSIKGRDSRSVRVTYTGPKAITGEMAYRIVATELPVKFHKKVKAKGVEFLFRFIASVYVTSETFTPKLEIQSITKGDGDKTKIKISNTGNKHRQLKGVKVVLKDKSGQTLALNDNTVKNWSASNILAGGERIYSLKTDAKLEFSKSGSEIVIKDEN